MNDLISVIVPVYKAEKYLKECIDSIINQTYENLEIILIDDGSPDGCPQICDGYAKKDARIKVIHSDNKGVSVARNSALDIATGEWVIFVDADDWIEKNYCELLLEKSKKYNADVAICGYNRISNNFIEKVHASGKCLTFNSKEYLNNSLNPQTGFGMCGMKFIKMKCIKDVRFNEKLTVGEDALFNIKLSQNIEIAVFAEFALYNYRLNSESVVKKYDVEYEKKYLKAMNETKEYIWTNYKSSESVIQNYYNFVAYHILLIAVNYCYHSDNKIKNKRELLKQICEKEEFKEAIKKSNYKNISITRKITLFTLKFRIYFVTECICKYRQKQNKRGYNGRK